MESLIPRNNTSFIRSIIEVIKKIEKTDPLKYHQYIINEYVAKYPHLRGLLVYWEMGAGKTLLAVSIVESLKSKFKRTFFISSKTLHNNFISDYKKYLSLTKNPISEDDERMEKYIGDTCNFITLTANNMLQQIFKAIKHNGDEIIDKTFEDFISQHKFDKEMEDTSINPDYIKNLRDEIRKLNMVGNLDDTLLIVDEAHNFFNGITNGSKNYAGLYQLIMDAKNIKLIFLTGSPIINDPFEIALCFNMLQGYYKVSGSNEQLTLFGEDYDDFNKYFVGISELDSKKKSTEVALIKHKDKFANRITGLVSYYGIDQEDIQKLFPELKELIVQKVPMSTPQYAAYSAARDKEQDENKRVRPGKSPLMKPQGMSSSYRVHSRQISNFLYPSYAMNVYKDEKGYTRSEKFIEKLKPSCFEINSEGLETWSPKMLQLMVNLSIHLPENCLTEFKKLSDDKKWMPILKSKKEKIGIGPGIIYSQFIDAGIGLIAKILTQYGMKEIKSVEDAVRNSADNDLQKNNTFKGTFAIISGEIKPELRTEVVNLAMSPENKLGSLLTLLLITATGAEGVNTKYMRHIHALEPFWHWSRLAQVFARAARLGSHIDLPESERNVQPYIYLSDYPTVFEDKDQMKIKSIEDTTDVTLYYRCLQNQILINSYLDTLKESSIDCLIHYKDSKDIKCRICQPTNEPLFLMNLDKDMKVSSPCRELKEEKIKAESVIIEDKDGKREYMYAFDKDNFPHFFMYQPSINAYQEIFEDSPDYFALFNQISK